MNPLRAFTVAGVVGAATLGSGLFADLFGVPDHVASGQALVARTPSLLPATTGYAPAPGYTSTPGYYTTPAYSSAPAYNPQPTPVQYGSAAYPASGYRPAYPQAVPYQYQPTTVQPAWNNVQPAWNSGQPSSNYVQTAWPYVQSSEGQSSVLLGRNETLGGPPLASPHVQQPTPPPSYSGPQHHAPLQQLPRPSAPMYQMPNNQMQTQPMPEYAQPGYAMPGSSYGGSSCDVGAEGDFSTYRHAGIRNWFGSVGALGMTRDRADHYTFSYGTLDEADQRTDTRNAEMGWTGGVDVRFGRYFNCQRNAIEAVYWGLYPVSQSTQTTSADVLGDLNGILNWNSLDYGGNTADIYVNVAPGDDGVHRLTRENSFQNIELNLWHFCGSCATGDCKCPRLRTNWLAGVRYFQFDESLLFASNPYGTQITEGDDEIYYLVDIENHLLGFQVGNQLQYCLTNRLTADLGTKLGIYGNQINHVSEIGGNLGTAIINNGPFAGEQFWVGSSKNDVAFLGELNVGLRYCLAPCWTGTIGYRALAVTGVAMPADQIYPDLRGINDVANIDSSRALILHGGYLGIEYNW